MDTFELTAWEATFFCRRSFALETMPGQKQPNELNAMCRNCKLSLRTPELLTPGAISMRKCQSPVISTCRNNSEQARNSCKQYTALVKFGSDIFKNPHCLLCNKHNVTDLLSCEGNDIPDYLPNGIMKPPEESQDMLDPDMHPDENRGGVSYSVLLNFNDLSDNGMRLNIQHQETVVECNEGEVFVTGQDGSVKCVRVSCSDGFRLQDGECEPVTKDVRCGINSEKVTVEVRVIMTNGSCQDGSIRNTTRRFLIQLFKGNKSSDVNFKENATVCSQDSRKVVTVSYIVVGSVGLFAIIQNQLDSRSVIDDFPQDAPGVSNKIKELEITKSCLNPAFEYKCDFHWIPESKDMFESKKYKIHGVFERNVRMDYC